MDGAVLWIKYAAYRAHGMDPQKINRLKKRVDKNKAFREAEALRIKDAHERLLAYNQAPETTRMDFWCTDCRKDFQAFAFRSVRTVLNLDTGRSHIDEPLFAWYEGKCPKGHIARRYITDKHIDPYYDQSRLVAAQRAEFADDLVQPSDPRFKKLYPAAWREMEAAREAQESAGV